MQHGGPLRNGDADEKHCHYISCFLSPPTLPSYCFPPSPPQLRRMQQMLQKMQQQMHEQDLWALEHTIQAPHDMADSQVLIYLVCRIHPCDSGTFRQCPGYRKLRWALDESQHAGTCMDPTRVCHSFSYSLWMQSLAKQMQLGNRQ